MQIKGKKIKGERKTEKNGGKGLKNASFWVINSKNFAPPSVTLFAGAKMNLKGGGGEKMFMMLFYRKSGQKIS